MFLSSFIIKFIACLFLCYLLILNRQAKIHLEGKFMYIFTLPLIFIIAIFIFSLLYSNKKNKHITYIEREIPSTIEHEEIILPEQPTIPNENITITSTMTVTYRDTSEKSKHKPYPIPDVSQQIRYHCYKVTGINPSTHHRKSQLVVAKEGSSEEEILARSYLLNPSIISLDDSFYTESSPYESDFSIASDLNITAPDNCTRADLLCLILKANKIDSSDIRTNSLAEYAAINGVCLSPYCGSLESALRIMRVLKEEESLHFFVYLVYCVLYKQTLEDPRKSLYADIFYSFRFNDAFSIQVIERLDPHLIERFWKKGSFDKRFKSVSALYEQICEYLSNNIPQESLNFN